MADDHRREGFGRNRGSGGPNWRNNRNDGGRDGRPSDRNGSDRNRGGDREGGYRGNRDNDRGGYRGGRDNDRGGYRGGRDNDRGGYRGGRDNDRQGGYRGNRDNDRGGYQRRDDDRGGYRGNRDNDRQGGYRGNRDNDRQSGYRGNRDNDRQGGYRGGRDNDRQGGYRGGRDNDRQGGYRGNRDSDRQGGYRGGRDHDRQGGYRGGRDNDRQGGYRGGRDNDRQGGYQRRDDDRGGYRGNRDNDRQGGYRGNRDNDRGGYQRRDDDRGGYRGGNRDDRRGNDRGGFQRRDDRGGRTEDRFAKREDQKGSTAEYISRDPDEPGIPAGVAADELDKDALKALSTLSGNNKDIVARHLVMAGQLIDIDPELAYRHAQAAVTRAGRVDVVREAAALTAYASGRYEEALREVRAVRRMRGDDSLRAVEADSERGLGRPEKAIEIIDETSTQGMDLADQVELVLVSSGARADLGQSDVGLVIVDDALAALPADTDPFLTSRLMSVKADRLRELGRADEADAVEAEIPEVEEEEDIVDLAEVADVDVDNKRTDLRGTSKALNEVFDSALLDLDGVAYAGTLPIDHAADAVKAAEDNAMNVGYMTNNASRTPDQVAEKLRGFGFTVEPEQIMTAAMDIAAIMKDVLDEGVKVLVIGGDGLVKAVTDAGFEVVESADDEPAAVVQGFSPDLDWARLSEAVYAIQKGARFFASNLDATLPTERGFALGNGSLVRAVQNATNTPPQAGGKPEPGIYMRSAELVDAQNPVCVGDRLDTDVLGAIRAGYPAMHVLTGSYTARQVILAPRGQRPSFLAMDLRQLNEPHPQPKHHRDGTWTCGFSQVVKATRNDELTVDGVVLTDPTTVTLDTYRALAAAAWDHAADGYDVTCPEITVVDNDDPAGTVVAPEPVDEPAEDAADEIAAEDGATETNADEPIGAPLEDDLFLSADFGDTDEDADDDSETDGSATDAPSSPIESGDTPTFLPGEEELEELLNIGEDEEFPEDDGEEI